MKELSNETKKLISRYKLEKSLLEKKEEENKEISTIHVDEFASKVATFYEKLRMIVDWKEEHLIRRTAIIRKLKRRFVEWEIDENISREKMAEPLVLELIRGGHFPNDKIEETKIDEVQKVIEKYLFIFKNKTEIKNKREKLQFYNWLIEVMACEIEETLSPFIKENALIDFMYNSMKEKIVLSEKLISEEKITEEEKDTQIYIAVCQALFKLDYPIISYNLLKKKYKNWKEVNKDELLKISQNIVDVWKNIEKSFSHPLGNKFYTICEKYDTPYLLLGDILAEENLDELLKKISEPENLEILIRKAYNNRLNTLKKRLFRAGLYSTLSILLGNALSLIILEIPLAKLITGVFKPITILVDILGPTFLMFLFVSTIKLPSKKNLNLVIIETMKIVYETKEKDKYEIKMPVEKKFKSFIKFIIAFFYLLGALITFGFIIWIFNLSGFPPTSMIINIVFITLITFAGLGIRKKAEELTIEEKKEGLLGFITDILLLPVAGVGKWLSNKWKKYNAIAAFFNALIDMPFSFFVEFLENWRFFLKEKKEEIH